MEGSFNTAKFETEAQNYIEGSPPDDRAGILRIDHDGNPVGKGLIGGKFPNSLYYAYGIKNSFGMFGMDFDPIAGNLWDSEMVQHMEMR